MTKNVKIDDHVWRALRKRAVELARAYAKVGIVGTAATADHGGSSNVEIAIAHELGTATIPRRSFIRQAMRQRPAEFRALAARLARAFIFGRMSVEQVMGLLGAWGAGAIKATITTTGTFAPLSPRTIARKGSSRPLVDTAQMLNSVSWIVVA